MSKLITKINLGDTFFYGDDLFVVIKDIGNGFYCEDGTNELNNITADEDDLLSLFNSPDIF